MITSAFMAQLEQRGIRVWLEGDRLRCNAPEGTLTPALLESIAERKAEIAAYLRVASAPPSSLVPIQPDGPGRPFFAVPGHTGDVFCFVHLARNMGRDRPFHALEPPPLHADGDPVRLIEVLASEHVQKVLEAPVDGPLYLGGFCVGGLIAFEMARQLHFRGREVAELILFDTSVPAAQGALRNAQVALRSSVGRALRTLSKRSRPDSELRIGPDLSQSARAYVPSVHPGRICVFAANDETARLGRQHAWADYSALGVDLEAGPDDCHPDGMLDEPNVRWIAERLRQRLTASDRKAAAS